MGGLRYALAVVLAGACGGGDTSTTAAGGAPSTASGAAAPGTAGEPGAPAPATTAAPAPLREATPVPEALRFTVAGVDGAQVVGADYAGKDVALWFWAPW